MKNLLKRKFALTDSGAIGMMKASVWSCLAFLSYILPMMIIMLFMKDTMEHNERSVVQFWILLIAFSAVMFLIHYFEYNSSYSATFKEAANLRIDIANMLKRLPLSYFSKHNLADLAQTIMKDVANIEMALSHAVAKFIGFIAYFIIMAIMLISGNIYLGLVIIVPILLSFITLIISKKIQISGATKYYYRLRDNSDAFQEAIELQQEIRSYGQINNVSQHINEKINDTEKVHIDSELVMSVLMNFSIAILKCVPGLTILLGSILYKNNQVSLLFVIGYLIACIKIADGLEGVYEYLGVIFYFDASFQRINELRNTKLQEGNKGVELKGYDIELNNVGFGYNPEYNVIDGISFTASQNQVTALVGPSGCGKTTVLRLMSRLYDYDTGEIKIGGVDIKNIAVEDLFDKISIVFQDVMLFDTSIMENIRLGRKDATDEEVIRAAKLANVDEFVNKLPDGYDSVIGENGSKLSGGERQRISIARAILKDAPIIILDEIAASLDVENEMKIQDSLNILIKNKTVVIISHRMKSIENVDKIVVLDKGKVDSVGTHQELIEKSELYRSMIERSTLSESYIY